MGKLTIFVVAAVAGSLGAMMATYFFDETAGANHIAGATYSGTVEGGGTITFTVAADGTQIDSLTVQNVPAGGCPDTTFFNIPIVDHTFTRPGGSSISGSFASPGNAEGALSLDRPSTICDASTKNWTATTGGPSPTPTPTSTPGGNPIQGDIDCDGDVDEDDFLFLLAFAAGLNDGTTPAGCLDLSDPESNSGFPWGDVNCDGFVNALDALYVMAYLAGVPLEPVAGNCFEMGQAMSV